MESDFYTFKGYDRMRESELSPAMEDYLEMICRCAQESDFVRINLLASKLNVTPPSASKMVGKLKELGLLKFEPYGLITVTEKGWEQGEMLLHRHAVLHTFFCLVNGTDDELELVEKIEHFIDPETTRHLEEKIGDMKRLWGREEKKGKR